MFRSIRGSLQMWHAAVLATVLVAFGLVAHFLLRVTTDEQINADLDRVSDRLVFSMRRPRLTPGPEFLALGNALKAGDIPGAKQLYDKMAEMPGRGRRRGAGVRRHKICRHPRLLGTPRPMRKSPAPSSTPKRRPAPRPAPGKMPIQPERRPTGGVPEV